MNEIIKKFMTPPQKKEKEEKVSCSSCGKDCVASLIVSNLCCHCRKKFMDDIFREEGT